VDNTHTIESIALETKDILKLDDLEIMVMATNKEGERRCLLQNILLIIAQENHYMICLLGRQNYIDIVKLTATGWLKGASFPFLFFFSFSLCVLECSHLELLFHWWGNSNT
jgi:hypothetical protein